MSSSNSSSRKVLSNQAGVHESLELIVRKHFESEFKKPIAEHTRIAFENIQARVELELAKGTSLHFDSFCGTGVSTVILAGKNPDALIIGLDRSSARLSKTYNKVLSENMILLQADCVDFWFLAKQAGWELDQHYIFYPNPYPKAKHVKRRCHAHPSYPLLFELGGEIELRTNWKIYADEFSQSFIYALDYLEETKLRCSGVEVLSLDNGISCDDEYMTLFEKKYAEDDQKLYSCKYGLY